MSGFFLSRDAEEDLQDIYIFSENNWGEKQAEKYIYDLYETFKFIAENPKLGRVRPELGKEIRSKTQSSHVIIFTEWKYEIAILRILHSSRDIPNAHMPRGER